MSLAGHHINFRFQAFEVASASNAIKAHFLFTADAQGYYGDDYHQRAEGLPSPVIFTEPGRHCFRTDFQQ